MADSLSSARSTVPRSIRVKQPDSMFTIISPPMAAAWGFLVICSEGTVQQALVPVPRIKPI